MRTFKLRTVFLYLMLLVGNMAGVSIRPQDIEETLHRHKQTKVERFMTDEDEDDDEN
jgi:hypothetical protein